MLVMMLVMMLVLMLMMMLVLMLMMILILMLMLTMQVVEAKERWAQATNEAMRR